MSGIINKAKDAVDKIVHPEHKDKGGAATDPTVHGHGSSSTNAGPHSSNVANKTDPRVDSDMDGSRNMGAATGTTGYTTGTHGHNIIGTTGGTGLTDPTVHGSTTGGPHSTNIANSKITDPTIHGSTNAGPHSSNLANAADPRIDSDLDGSRTVGGSAGPGYGSTTAGPHSSNLANKGDPRVDSDLDGSRTLGTGAGTTRTTGGLSGPTGVGGLSSTHGGTTGGAVPGLSSTTGGTHGGFTGTTGGMTGATGGTTGMTGGLTETTGGVTGSSGPGPAPKTAGPHSSDMANKLDPRVDSDLDGSKTVGGNKTYTDDTVYGSPPDAASHPPSAFRERLSDENLPVASDHGRRHSLKGTNTKDTLHKYGSGHE